MRVHHAFIHHDTHGSICSWAVAINGRDYISKLSAQLGVCCALKDVHFVLPNLHITQTAMSSTTWQVSALHLSVQAGRSTSKPSKGRNMLEIVHMSHETMTSLHNMLV